MAKRATAVLREQLDDHPAVRAWEAVQSGPGPTSVEVLKEKRHSAVFRLNGVGVARGSVVAKRAARASIEIETRVYRDVLPNLRVSATRLLGTFRSGARSWLLLEDVGDARFEPGDAAHRRLAAAWMASVHGGARLLPEAGELPARRADHYLELRRSVEALLGETLLNPALSGEERAVVEGVARACDAFGASWPGVVAAFDEAPSTIALGGFCGKNARVRSTADGPLLMPFDFESAGYGCPAIDLAFLDGSTYVREAKTWWSGLDDAGFRRLRGVGCVLGGLKAITGERGALLSPSPSKAIEKLEWYRREMLEGMSAAELGRA